MCAYVRVRLSVRVRGVCTGVAFRHQKVQRVKEPPQRRGLGLTAFLLQGHLGPGGSRTHICFSQTPSDATCCRGLPCGAAPTPPAVPPIFLHLSLLPLGCPRKLLPTCPNSCLYPPAVPSFCPGRRPRGSTACQAKSALEISTYAPQIPQQNHPPQGPTPHTAQRSWCLFLPGPRGYHRAPVPRRVVHNWCFPLVPLPVGEAKPLRPCRG